MVRKHTRPRTRTRPSDWGVAPVTACAARAARAGMAAPAQDGAAPADKRKVRCASPDGQSAHRLPVSFARFSTALSRSADYPPTQLRRPARLPRPCRRAVPTTRSAARSASTTERDFVAARMTAAKPESQRPVGQSVGRPTSNTTAWVAIKFHRADRAGAVHEEPDVRRDRCSGWCGAGWLTDLSRVRHPRRRRVPVVSLASAHAVAAHLRKRSGEPGQTGLPKRGRQRDGGPRCRAVHVPPKPERRLSPPARPQVDDHFARLWFELLLLGLHARNAEEPFPRKSTRRKRPIVR